MSAPIAVRLMKQQLGSVTVYWFAELIALVYRGRSANERESMA
jgi:hypothetical protein